MRREKRYIRKMIVLMSASLLLAGAVTGCGAGREESVSEQAAEQTLHIGIQPAVGFLPLYIMRDQGTLEHALEDAGYEVEVTYTEYESGPAENEAFAAGLVDVGVMGNVPALSGIASGQDRTLIGIAYNGEATEAIIVPKDSQIKTVADLKGKKIGLVVGSIAQNLVSNVFETSDISFRDVEFVNLSAGEQQQALINGQVDAVATWEPTISKLTADGSNVVLADGTGVFLGENPILARGDYVESHREIIEIFLQEYKKAATLLESDTKAYAKEYSDDFGLEETIMETALANAKMPIAIGDADVEDLQKTAEFLKREELVTKLVNVKDYVDVSFSETRK